MPVVTLANAKTFNCAASLTLLEAARVQGLALEHSCRTGRCGVCKALVLSGTTSATQHEASLSDEERARGMVLTCCRTADTDLSLDIEDLGALGSIKTKTIPCRIDSIAHLSQDVIHITLRTPPASSLIYLAGQYIDVLGPNGLRRSYSIANAPRPDGKLTLQIRKVATGAMSHYWFHQAKPNDLLRLEGPLGTFCLRPSSAARLILLATGTGIAPINSILEQLAAQPANCSYSQIHLYWGGRTAPDLYTTPRFPGLPLRYVPVLSRATSSSAAPGYVQQAVLADRLPLADADLYACGSEAMIASARQQLLAAGLPPKNFRSDAFVSSNQTPQGNPK